MKTLNRFINELAPIGKIERPTVIATDSTIKRLVEEGIAKYGKDANLNYIDVSEVTDMDSLFAETDFSGDISRWDVSNVTNMNSMFNSCGNFNCPLNDWDVSNVTWMAMAFWDCKKFDQPLNNWDVSKVTDMSNLFTGCRIFNQNISNWKLNPSVKI